VLCCVVLWVYIPMMMTTQIVYLTNPEKWSVQAVYVATRLFASNLNPKMAQRFYSLVLLPRMRDNIAMYKKLNYHLYQVQGILSTTPSFTSASDSLHPLRHITSRNPVPPFTHSRHIIHIACNISYFS
jgi:hypothetical protein